MFAGVLGVATGDRAACYSVSTSRLSSSTLARPSAIELATELALDDGGALEASSSRDEARLTTAAAQLRLALGGLCHLLALVVGEVFLHSGEERAAGGGRSRVWGFSLKHDAGRGCVVGYESVG
jgi:hypothetical protein